MQSVQLKLRVIDHFCYSEVCYHTQVIEAEQHSNSARPLRNTWRTCALLGGILGVWMGLAYGADSAKSADNTKNSSAKTSMIEKWAPVGPFGGAGDAIAVSAKSGVLIAASRGGRLFRSANHGNQWDPMPFPAESNATVRAILFTGEDDQEMLIGVTHDHQSGVGMYQTLDGGSHWRAIPQFRGKPVWALAAWAKDPKRIAAGAADGVFLSGDGGASWRRISPPGKNEVQPVVSVAFDPSSPGIIFAGTPHLPWRTTDEGASWQSIHKGIIDDSDIFSIAPSLRAGGLFFLSACTGIYRTEDGGDGWSKLHGSAEASYRTYVILPDPNSPNRVWAGTTAGLQRSLNGGTSWETVLPNAVKSIAVDGSGYVYAATGSGLLRSDANGENFESINNGFEGRQESALFAAADSLFVAGNEGAQVRYSRLGPWRTMRPADADIVVASPRRGELVAAAGRLLYISADGGGAWKPLEVPGSRGQFTAVAVLGSNDALQIWAASADGLFTGVAGRWRKLANHGFDGQAVRTILADGGGRVLIASRQKAAMSSDNGASWIHLPVAVNGLGSENFEWEGFAFNPADRSLVAATSHGIFLLETSQSRWRETKGPESASVSSIVFHPKSPNVVFAAQQSTVLFSTDGGRTWRGLVRNGLSLPAQIKCLTTLPSEPGRLYALVARRGVYSTLLPSDLNVQAPDFNALGSNSQ